LIADFLSALAPIQEGAALSRVILLSDGNANAGETDVPTIVSQCGLAAGKGVTTSFRKRGAIRTC